MKTSNPVVLAPVLFLITAIVTFALAFVNSLTEPVIAMNTEQKITEAQQAVLDADEFSDDLDTANIRLSETGVSVDALKLGFTDGECVGYVVTTTCSEGYGGDIQVMVGINNEGGENTVNKIEILSLSETPGLGANAQKDTFKDQYGGKEAGITVKKGGGATGNEIDAISGATITSKAVTKAVNAALEAASGVVVSSDFDESEEPESVEFESTEPESVEPESAEPENADIGDAVPVEVGEKAEVE